MATLEDHFILFKKIGSGSFGEVYEAFDLSLKKKIALKTEDQSQKRRIKYEFELYKELMEKGMPGIPKVYHLLKGKQYIFMSMDLLGPTLESLLRATEGRRMAPSTVALYGEQIITLLEDLHLRGVIHRDIKPNNFLLGEDKRLRIIDFGLARKYVDARGKHFPYRTGKSLVGTARYVSINIHLKREASINFEEK